MTKQTMDKKQDFQLDDRTDAARAIRCLEKAGAGQADEIYRTLFAQAQSLGLMPDDRRCIYAMIQAYGYVRQATVIEDMLLGEVYDMLKQRAETDLFVIYNHGYAGGQYDSMFIRCDSDEREEKREAINDDKREVNDDKNEDRREDINGNKRKVKGEAQEEAEVKNEMPYKISSREVRHIWVKCEGGEEHTPFPRQKRKASGRRNEHMRPQKSALYFESFQPNPMQLNIGDCVLRGLSGVLEIPWEEVMERLSAYGHTTVNSVNVFEQLLDDEGLKKCNPIIRNRRRLTGKEFCEVMSYSYRKGERIFAFVGPHHVAAVLPYEDENGEISYRITDSWDSTDCRIGRYWVRFPEGEPKRKRKRKREIEAEKRRQEEDRAKAAKEAERGSIPPGTLLCHPSYGEGRVLGETAGGANRILEIDFREKGKKKLNLEWVKAHCTVSSF